MNANETQNCPCGPSCGCGPCLCTENDAPEEAATEGCGAGCTCES